MLEKRLSKSKHECFLQSGWSPVWKQCKLNTSPCNSLENPEEELSSPWKSWWIALPAFQIEGPSSFFFDIKKSDHWEFTKCFCQHPNFHTWEHYLFEMFLVKKVSEVLQGKNAQRPARPLFLNYVGQRWFDWNVLERTINMSWKLMQHPMFWSTVQIY